ncbi:MAG: efflux RND transporter permease subunit, partial [Clostridia bacterium]|nr:efflux RND transporter permease subunit [Clostridia bacterium]
MRKFFAFIIRQSVAVVLISLFILGFGVWSTLNMSINLLPDINIPVVCVQVVYAGANASTVEKDVTEKVEDGLSSLGGVTDVMSYSYDNLSAVVFYFDYDADTTSKKSEIQSKLSSVDLPDGVSTSVYDVDLNAEPLAVLSLTSSEGLDDAYDRAKELSVKLSAIEGVESVELKGGAETTYLIQPFGGLELISPLIVETFSYGALDLPLGTLTENGGVQIKNESDITSEEEIYNTPLTLPESVVALLAGIRAGIEEGAGMKIPVAFADFVIKNPTYMARIKEGLAQNPVTENLNVSDDLIKFIMKNEFPESGTMTVKVEEIASIDTVSTYGSHAYYFDGGVNIADGIVVNIYKSNGANSSKVVKNVKAVYAEVAVEEGYSATINLLDDQSEFISDSVSNVLISMLIGGVLAIIIIFLFLKKVRTSLVIAITMPLSVLAALICLFLLGVTLNMVSLGGLAVGIGMLVDNSIVVIEAITKHRDGGKDAFNAAVDGTCEVGGALFGSTVTTVCVFIPIMFAGGLTAEIFTDLALAVIFSLTFSLLVAVTVIPTLYTL